MASKRTDDGAHANDRVDVYRAQHRVEARRARSWLLSHGIDDVEMVDRVFRADAHAPAAAYDGSGYVLRVSPAQANAARKLFEEARAAEQRFGADRGDVGPLA